MQQWKLVAAAARVAMLIAVNALWSFYRSLAPVPSELAKHAGTLSELRLLGERFSQTHFVFTLTPAEGLPRSFACLRSHAHCHQLAQQLKVGMAVEVQTGPSGDADLWGIRQGAQTLLTAEQARDARRSDGHWSLAIFLGFAASALWSAREAAGLRRRPG